MKNSTQSKIEKAKLLLEDLIALEKQEEIIMSLGGKASNGECKSFNLRFSSNSFKKSNIVSKEEVSSRIKVIRAEIERTIYGIDNPFFTAPVEYESKTKNDEFTIEVGDSDFLNFLGLSMSIIAHRKKKIILQLKRLGIQI